MALVDIYIELVRDRDRLEFWRTTGSVEFPPHSVFIRFHPRKKEDEHAMYFPEAGAPRIEIYRYGCPSMALPQRAVDMASASPCPLDELVSLSHELGHHDSAVRGSFWPLDEARPLLTYEEEVRAWLLGRNILLRRNYAEWSAFEERERRSLSQYRQGLKLTEKTAEEIEERIRRAGG
jgi:hypothetical protein